MIKTKSKLSTIMKAEVSGFLDLCKKYLLNIFLSMIVLLYGIKSHNIVISIILITLSLFILPHNSKMISKYMDDDSDKYYFHIMGLVIFNVVSYSIIGILFILLLIG